MTHLSFQSSVLLAAAAAAALVSAAGPLAAADRIGVNAAVRNTVQEKAAGEGAYRPAVVRTAVSLGDAVVSGQNSALQVLLLDKSVFTVGANARLTFDRFVYDPNRKASDVAASVAKGSFRFMSGPTLSGQGRNVVTTPVGSIGVRGTVFEGVVGQDVLAVLAGQGGLPPQSGDPDLATLVVLRGPGLGNTGLDRVGAIDVTANGVTVALTQPGQAALIWPGHAPFVFWLSDTSSARLAELVLGGPSGPGNSGQIPGSVQVALGVVNGPLGSTFPVSPVDIAVGGVKTVTHGGGPPNGPPCQLTNTC